MCICIMDIQNLSSNAVHRHLLWRKTNGENVWHRGQKSRYNFLSQNTLHTIVQPKSVTIHTELQAREA